MNIIEKLSKQKENKKMLKGWIDNAIMAKQEIKYYSEKRDYKNCREAEEYLVYCKDAIDMYIRSIAYLEGSVSGEKKIKDKLMKKVKKVLGE